MNNKPKTKLLTISLLCCGRVETTERCLKSLMPIREAIDSEIQVVDTGCSPETRAIVEKYADEVFEFTWCNDFAAARNFQLDQANGKMFLFIDDDEFFLDCKYIIDFFKQPDCTSYNIGGYFQRNYLDFKGVEYEDVEVVRMCSVTPKTYFVGKVHEYIEPAYGNAMFMDAQAGHFGYVYTSMEDNIKHSMRNIPLLKEMYEEMPDNLRWPYQLAQEYRAIKYFDELYDVCKQGFDHSFDVHEEESIRYRGPFACGIAIALYEKHKYDELLEFYYKEIDTDDMMDVAKAKLTLYAAQVMFIREMNDECEKAVNFYFAMYDRYALDRGQMFLQGGIFINDVFDELHMNTMYCYLMTIGLRRDDFGPLVHYYRKITWDSKVVRINRGFIMTLTRKSAEHGYKREIKDVYNKFFTRPGFRDVLQKEIDDVAPGLSTEELKNIKAAYKNTSHEKEMNLFMDVRICEAQLSEAEDISYFTGLLDVLLEYAATVEEWHRLHLEWMEEDADRNEYLPEVHLAGAFRDFAEVIDEDPKEALKILKDVVGVRPKMDSVIQTLSKLYADYVKVLSAKQADPAKFQEMYDLEDALLAQIAELDAAGKSEEAVATYRQLVDVLHGTFGVDTLHM